MDGRYRSTDRETKIFMNEWMEVFYFISFTHSVYELIKYLFHFSFFLSLFFFFFLLDSLTQIS